MNFETKISKVGIKVSSSIPSDTYGKYLGEFLEDIEKTIPNNKMLEIIQPLLDLKSWRLLNREVRKACNQYCYDNKIMTHAEFQEKYFYESVMLGRTMYGKNAPWIGEADKPQEKKRIFTEKKKVIDTEGSVEANVMRPSKGKPQAWDMSIQWDFINSRIAERLYAE